MERIQNSLDEAEWILTRVGLGGAIIAHSSDDTSAESLNMAHQF